MDEMLDPATVEGVLSGPAAPSMGVEGRRRTVLFICTGNAARSQMAEGLLRHMYGDRFWVVSGGVSPSSVSPHAIRAMSEIGIDISHHRSKDVREFLDRDIDIAVTLCDHARESCPVFPRAKMHVHRSFEDPYLSDDPTEAFRRVRDEIRGFIGTLFGGDDDDR